IVRAGNGRVAAARELGWTEIAAVIVDESNLDAASFALADNRTAELASWDGDALRQILLALQADDEIPIGWDDDELAQLLDEVTRADVVEDEVPDVPEEATSELGQLWALGRHRLLCGDATSQAALARLMG